MLLNKNWKNEREYKIPSGFNSLLADERTAVNQFMVHLKYTQTGVTADNAELIKFAGK
jgi:hypothetical protein